LLTLDQQVRMAELGRYEDQPPIGNSNFDPLKFLERHRLLALIDLGARCQRADHQRQRIRPHGVLDHRGGPGKTGPNPSP